MSTMTSDEGELLAQLINKLRPEWGIAGTRKALYEAREKAPALALTRAALAAAADADNRTPAIIGLPGPHWHGLEAKPKPPTAEELCDTCGRPEPVCRRIARRTGDDHRFVTVAEAEAQRASAKPALVAGGLVDALAQADSSNEGEA